MKQDSSLKFQFFLIPTQNLETDSNGLEAQFHKMYDARQVISPR